MNRIINKADTFAFRHVFYLYTPANITMLNSVELKCTEVRTIKNLANIITGSRIAGAVFILFTAPFSLPFFICYTFCGFTDILDGMAARITHSESRAGAALDSFADLIFILSASVKTFSVLLPEIPAKGIYFCFVIAAIKIASYIVGIVKFHKFAALHTNLNKLSGASLFCLPYICKFLHINTVLLTIILCLLSATAAVDELLCILKSNHLNSNIKSMFSV